MVEGELERNRKKITILVPCYNEVNNIRILYERILAVIEPLDQYQWEFLFVDNCSTDGTIDILRELAKNSKQVKVIINQANFGIAPSLKNARRAIKSDAIIQISSDLQEPPELIPQFLEAWEQGYKVVLGQYISTDENPLLQTCRKLYYWLLMRFSDERQEKNVTGGFGLRDMSVQNIINNYDDPYVTSSYMLAKFGYKYKCIPFQKQRRASGRSSFTIRKYYRTAVNDFIRVTYFPLHIMCPIGLMVIGISALSLIVYLLNVLLGNNILHSGTVGIFILVLLGGLQLFFIGIIGEYMELILDRVIKRPDFLERERINFED